MKELTSHNQLKVGEYYKIKVKRRFTKNIDRDSLDCNIVTEFLEAYTTEREEDESTFHIKINTVLTDNTYNWNYGLDSFSLDSLRMYYDVTFESIENLENLE